MFISRGKNIFSQPLPCKKVAVKLVIFFFNKYFFNFFCYCNCFFVFFIQKSENLYGFIFFSFFGLNVAEYVLKKTRIVDIINPLKNKPNTAKTENTL